MDGLLALVVVITILFPLLDWLRRKAPQPQETFLNDTQGITGALFAMILYVGMLVMVRDLYTKPLMFTICGNTFLYKEGLVIENVLFIRIEISEFFYFVKIRRDIYS